MKTDSNDIVKRVGDALLEHVRSVIQEKAKGDPDVEFKTAGYLHGSKVTVASKAVVSKSLVGFWNASVSTLWTEVRSLEGR